MLMALSVATDAMRCASRSGANPSRPASSSAVSKGVRETEPSIEEEEEAALLSVGGPGGVQEEAPLC